MKPLVLIVGPTASGKSSLGMSLGQEFGGGILNCDSLQTYRRLDIGTAKPTLEERMRVPHYLFDQLAPGEVLTAGDYRRLAIEVLERELPRRIVFGVGGSGFYIQALEKGMFEVDKPDPQIDAQVRREVVEHGPQWIYEELRRLDPEYAARLSPNDAYRVTRAVVIIRDSGETVTSLRNRFAAKPFPYPLLKLGLAPTRDHLTDVVRARTRAMLRAGLLEEVRALLDEGWRDWPPLQSVGYRECVQVINGEAPPEKLEDMICEKTLQLAKKQRTWFKRDPEIHWLDVENPVPQAERLLRSLDGV